MFKKVFYTTCLISCFFISGCGLETLQSGDLPSQTRLNLVKPGFPKMKVIELLGQPAFQNHLGNGDFFVYSKVIKKSRAFFEPKETERDIYVITFTPDDIVQHVEHLTLEDAQHVAYDETISTVRGKELSVIEQLVKNFGRYDAGGRDSSVRQ